MTRPRLSIALFLSAFLSACAGSGHQLPPLHGAELSGIQQEYARSAPQLKENHLSEAAYRDTVARAAQRLAATAGPLCAYTGYNSCAFEVAYNPEDTANAHATPGGKVTVYKGLLKYMESEDEIAAVIAHEMGHHMADHIVERQQNAVFGALVGGLVGTAMSSQGAPAANDMTRLGAQVGALSFSKEEEREADLLGQYLMSRAGYNLRQGERVMWLLMQLRAKDGGGVQQRASFTDTHPAGPERIASWRRVTAELEANPNALPYRVEKR